MINKDNHFAFLSEGLELAISLSNDMMSLEKNSGSSAIIEMVASRLSQLDIFESFAFYLIRNQIDFEVEKCIPTSALDSIEADIQAHIENSTFSWTLDNGRPLSITGPVSNNSQILFPLATRRRTHGMFIGNARGGEAVTGYMLSIIRMMLTIAIENIDSMSLTEQLVKNNQKLEERVHERTHELRQAIILAEEASRSKSDFLANMSHDIRTPMNGVLGMLDILRTTSLEQVQYDYVETAYRSGEHLLSLLNDILDLSKVESGSMDIEDVDFNLIKIIDDLVALFGVKAKENNNQIYSLVDENVPEVIVTDKTRLWQVLVNLLGNAMKFTKNGDIALRVSCMNQDNDSYDLRFEVEDSGVGIKPEALEMIFNPFHQAESSTTREYGGTGLGLALCKQLLELLDGEIGVDSELGKGSCFWFSLKAKNSQDSDNLKINYKATEKRVLLVGDNVYLHEAFSKYLLRLGVFFDSANDARKANEIIKSHATKDIHITTLLSSSNTILDELDVDYDDVSVWCPETNNSVSAPAHVLKTPVTFSSMLDILYEGGAQGLIDDQMYSKFNGSVLVVEDNEVNRLVISGMLKHLGVDIIIAENGREALEIINEQDFDIILMDVQMPEMDGYEVTRRVRRSATRNKDVIIVALTANVMKKNVDTGMAAGMNDYMGKPVSLQKINELFIRYLPVSSTHNKNIPGTNAILKSESIDKKAVDQLKMLMEDEFLGFVDLFLSQSNKHIGLLEKAIGTDKVESLLQAHIIKGSTGNIGAIKLASIAEHLEVLLEEDDITGASSLLLEIKEELSIVIEILQRR